MEHVMSEDRPMDRGLWTIKDDDITTSYDFDGLRVDAYSWGGMTAFVAQYEVEIETGEEDPRELVVYDTTMAREDMQAYQTFQYDRIAWIILDGIPLHTIAERERAAVLGVAARRLVMECAHARLS